MAAMARTTRTAPKTKKLSTRDQLLAKLRSVPRDTYYRLAEFIGERGGRPGGDPFHVGDASLLRHILDYETAESFPYGIGDAARSGEWHAAVDALERVLVRYPDWTVGNAVANVSARYWGPGKPDNRNFVRIVEWMLDGRSPHEGKQIIFAASSGDYFLGRLVREERHDGAAKGWHVRSGEVEVTFLASAFEGLQPLCRAAIIEPYLEDSFRSLLATSLEELFTGPTGSRAIGILKRESIDPDLVLKQVRSGDEVPLHPALYSKCRLVAEKLYGAPRAAYLAWRVFGHWPDSEAVRNA